ncbi:MAG: 50S ribosomal protein L11 methyltransferase [Anaerolineae bacterium]|nr:50S ribosomal protein L11 methyltransferase [Anaerolineae bacterium]
MTTRLTWLEICVHADGDTEVAEAVTDLFNRYGYGGAVVEAPVDLFEHELDAAPPPSHILVKTYLPLDSASGELRRRLEEGLWHLAQIYAFPEPAIRELAETDWAEAWKQHYHLLRIGKRLVIVPAWEAYDPAPAEIIIRLEPGMAFGTGLHPTTRLCLEAIERRLSPGQTVLDVGTGSGVLAIAVAKLGAGSILAIDADHQAVAVARQNVALNGVANQVQVRHSSLPGGGALPAYFIPDQPLELLDSGQFGLITANILAPVLVGMAPALAARLAPGGYLIAAGLVDSQENEVVAAFRAQELQIVDRSQERDWICLTASSSPPSG